MRKKGRRQGNTRKADEDFAESLAVFRLTTLSQKQSGKVAYPITAAALSAYRPGKLEMLERGDAVPWTAMLAMFGSIWLCWSRKFCRASVRRN